MPQQSFAVSVSVSATVAQADIDVVPKSLTSFSSSQAAASLFHCC